MSYHIRATARQPAVMPTVHEATNFLPPLSAGQPRCCDRSARHISDQRHATHTHAQTEPDRTRHMDSPLHTMHDFDPRSNSCAHARVLLHFERLQPRPCACRCRCACRRIDRESSLFEARRALYMFVWR